MMCPPSGRWEFVGVGHLLPSLKPSSLDFRTSAPNQCSLSSVLKGQQGKYKSGTKQEECFYPPTLQFQRKMKNTGFYAKRGSFFNLSKRVIFLSILSVLGP